ncbi:hypothetical protein IGI42_001509 [Enterococcus sp. AZ109]
MTEEVGEIAQAIRTIEIGRSRPDERTPTDQEQWDKLTEELGDVLGNLFILADKYDSSLEAIMECHQKKLLECYQ